MRIFVVVNHVKEIGFRQTTSLLISAMVRQNQDVWLTNVDAFSIAALEGQATAFAQATRIPSSVDCESLQVESFAKSGPGTSRQRLKKDDLVLIRTNPGRDNARAQIHESFLHLCTTIQTSGIRVVNSPENLRYFASKSSLASVDPRFRPAMVVTSDMQQALSFVRDAPTGCVAKPLFGSRGANVIRVTKSDHDLEAKLESNLKETTLVIQHFVESENSADKRVVVVGGQILKVNGNIAGIERQPANDDFRANLHAGGSAHELKLSDNASVAAQYAANLLHENGIWLAGVDLIGDKIIEFNVFSTGGLYDSIKFSGIRFDDLIVEKLLG